MIIRDVLQKKQVERIPVWFMRQAGRYLPEYRAIRQNYDDFMAFCYSVKDATEVTIQPLRRFDLDAAIIFSDILVIPDALGQKVSFQKDHGPVLGTFDLKKMLQTSDENVTKFLDKVYEAIALTRNNLEKDKALFGFAGTPWTLACYMIEEGKSQQFERIKNYCLTQDFTFLLEKLCDVVALHLKNQIKAGADVVQLFDSWAVKVPKGYEKPFIIDPFIRIAKSLHASFPNTPLIYYSRCDKSIYGAMLLAMKEQCPNFLLALGVWQGENISDFRSKTSLPLQGNLDPELLLKGGKEMADSAKSICLGMKDHPFIFNLGHGIIKETPPEHVEQLIAAVRSI